VSLPSSLIGLVISAPCSSAERVERSGVFVPSSLTGLLIPSVRRSALLIRLVGTPDGVLACQPCIVEEAETGEAGDGMLGAV
jgi:hypothetical protein